MKMHAHTETGRVARHRCLQHCNFFIDSLVAPATPHFPILFCSVLFCSVLPCPSCNQTNMHQHHSTTTSHRQPAGKCQTAPKAPGTMIKTAPKAPGKWEKTAPKAPDVFENPNPKIRIWGDPRWTDRGGGGAPSGPAGPAGRARQPVARLARTRRRRAPALRAAARKGACSGGGSAAAAPVAAMAATAATLQRAWGKFAPPHHHTTSGSAPPPPPPPRRACGRARACGGPRLFAQLGGRHPLGTKFVPALTSSLLPLPLLLPPAAAEAATAGGRHYVAVPPISGLPPAVPHHAAHAHFSSTVPVFAAFPQGCRKGRGGLGSWLSFGERSAGVGAFPRDRPPPPSFLQPRSGAGAEPGLVRPRGNGKWCHRRK
eukprot:gene14412-biopygen20103